MIYGHTNFDAGRIYTDAELASVEHDAVNKPKHYQIAPGLEFYDLRQFLAAKAQEQCIPHDQYSDWDRALEYLFRMWEKNEVEDLKKAMWYMEKLKSKLEE